MQSLKFSFVVAMVCALSATSSTTAEAANCSKITALGEMLSHDSAVLFANNALKNTLSAKGLVGKGSVTTTCKDGASTTTCRSTQMACTGGTPKTCLGAWLCF